MLRKASQASRTLPSSSGAFASSVTLRCTERSLSGQTSETFRARLTRRELPTGCIFPSTRYPLMRASYSTLTPEDKAAPKPQSEEDRALAFLTGFREQACAITPGDEAACLRVSYSVIYEITRYLARHGDESEAYLSVFMNSEAPSNSNIDVARKSVFQLTEYIRGLFSSVSSSSSLRQEHRGIFDLIGALEPLLMVYDGEGDTREWTAFWSRTQPILLELGVQLDKAGFGGD
ncbi:hypothetical protein DFH06DRAFT_716181 [Mycena polygramma]|nr:hypothetical protein DFH06DRAFT_716181 [Mycena polygramma]